MVFSAAVCGYVEILLGREVSEVESWLHKELEAEKVTVC